MTKKAIGVDAFCERLDKIFEMGDPTKAQIIDAYNKSVAEATKEKLTEKEMINALDKWIKEAKGTITFKPIE